MLDAISKLRVRMKKNEGWSIIPVVICVLTFLLCLYLIIQIIVAGRAYGFVNQTASFVARTVGEQGGLTTKEPADYTRDYLTSQEMYKYLQDGFNAAGYSDWEVTFNGKTFRSNSNITIPEQKEVELVIVGHVKPIAKVLRSSPLEVTAKRMICSSFETRTDGVGFIK